LFFAWLGADCGVKRPGSSGGLRQSWLRWGKPGTAAATIAARLTLDAIHHAYGPVRALRGVSLDVEPGEIICILGQSGCGKSTLLRVAAGLERPQQGVVAINGQEMAGPRKFVHPEQRGVGLMFQDYALFPHLTILENVVFGLHGLPQSEARTEGMAALTRVGMAGYAKSYPHMLSGGEQQRVALARAIVPRPGILLMDEPFSGLDRRLRDRVRDETLTLLRETRATCMIVTHDPEEAMRMADRIVLMRRGKVIQIGPPGTLYRSPQHLFTARFFSEVNEIDAIVNKGQVSTPIGEFPATGHADGTAVIVCLRHQGVDLLESGEGISARVVHRRFLGEVDKVELAINGMDALLQARIRSDVPHGRGADVQISVRPEDVLVFPAETP
jgi:iron(III) transport system ATP-binding protein